ncbi:MAG: uroporphyrinogen decarboxylase [Chlamydiales bacterium]|nr:uroporphyrinogen decarboxylase [Chlamydiales bacterium]
MHPLVMLLIESLSCNNQERPPVWLMRQAGRYLPQYQKVRKDHSLLEMFHNSDVITEVTLQPVDILGVDAAILFSDILTVLDGLGVEYDFQPGPKVNFQGFAPKENAYAHIEKAITQLKRELKVPLIGFAGGPITVMKYLLEEEKKMMICDEAQFEALFNTVLEETIAYLKVQENAGVDVIQVFDTWASTLPPYYFHKYVVRPLKRIVQEMRVPVILFCKGNPLPLVECAPACISVDWSQDLAQLRKQIPHTIALQGNLDPMILYGSKETIRYHAETLLDQMAGDPGYIFNLGHGMLPDIPVENVRTLIEIVQARPALHELSHSS